MSGSSLKRSSGLGSPLGSGSWTCGIGRNSSCLVIVIVVAAILCVRVIGFQFACRAVLGCFSGGL